jgi:predicted enzyme related to lactoylglutathione lyase
MNAPNGRPAVSDIGITHHHSDYTSHDVEGVRRFYTETLGLGNAIYIPEHGYLTVFFSPRSSLGFMAPMPGMPPESWSPPGEPNIYLFVEDVDRAHETLTARGVTFEMAPTDTPWGHRMAVLRDPEGRRVCLAKDLKR